jgi:hypothetical protein
MMELGENTMLSVQFSVTQEEVRVMEVGALFRSVSSWRSIKETEMEGDLHYYLVLLM